MKSVSGKKLCRIVKKKGWVLKRVKGSHHIYAHPVHRNILTIPVHGKKDLKIGILRSLMRIAQLTEDDLV